MPLRYLAKDSADYETLQLALSAAAGGTLLISESQEIDAALSISSETRIVIPPGVVLSVPGDLDGDIPAVFFNENSGPSVDDDRDHDIWIGGGGTLDLTGCTVEDAAGIALQAVVRAKVSGLTILNPPQDGVYLGAAVGDNTIVCEEAEVVSMSIDGAGRNGISVVGARGFTVDRNTCSNSVLWGIDIEPNSGGETTDGHVVGNRCLDNGYQGVQLAFAASDITVWNVIVERNICRGSTDAVYGSGIHVDTAGNTYLGLIVRANWTVGNANHGIWIQDATDVRVEDNFSDDNAGHALRLNTTSRCTAERNWLRQADPANNALQVDTADSCLIQENVLICDGGDNGFRADGLVNSRLAGNLAIYVSGSGSIGFYLFSDNTDNAVEHNMALGSWPSPLTVGTSGNGNSDNHVRFNDVAAYTAGVGGADVWLLADGSNINEQSPFVRSVMWGAL